MSGRGGRRRAEPRPRWEADLADPMRRLLEAEGYRVWVNPDGSDYFDLVARRRDEIGLVELKLVDLPKVIEQAVRRRVWADWSGVAVPGRGRAEKIVDRTRATPAARLGVWAITDQVAQPVRPAERWAVDADGFDAQRTFLRSVLDQIDAGATLGTPVDWGFVGSLPRGLRPGGRTPGREWRLEELVPDAERKESEGA